MTITELREADYLYTIITTLYEPFFDKLDQVKANNEQTAITINIDGIAVYLYNAQPENFDYVRVLVQNYYDTAVNRLAELGITYPEAAPVATS